MIKARGHDSHGRRLLLLGLSFQNLTRLRAGDPIEFDGTEYGYPGTIMIMAGRDEAVIANMLKRDNPNMTTITEKDVP